MRHILCFPISLYQRFISPCLPPHCRYSPSCSEYSMQAIQQHGVVKGSWLSMKRIARCNPLGSQGYDPVPESDNNLNTKAKCH